MADNLLTFDNLEKPTKAWDAPPEPVKTPCVGGPWNGATITHRPDDTKPRPVSSNRDGPAQIAGQVLGEYRYVGASHEPGHGHGDGWVWHPYIHAH